MAGSWICTCLPSLATQKIYLWGSSEVREEMSIPVCTSMTFRQPSSPVLRTWRLSVTQGDMASEVCGRLFWHSISGTTFTLMLLELLVLDWWLSSPWNASKTQGWWPFGVSSFPYYKLISPVSWRIKNNVCYCFSVGANGISIRYCAMKQSQIQATLFISRLFSFLHSYFKVIIPIPPVIICIEKDHTTWAKSSITYSPWVAWDLVQYGGRSEVPNIHCAFFGAWNQQCTCSI